jgi:hypothetical protein
VFEDSFYFPSGGMKWDVRLHALTLFPVRDEETTMKWNPLTLQSSEKRSRYRTTLRPRLEQLEARCLLATNVLTTHNDLLRTGDNLSETTLNPGNVNSSSFGQLFTYPVDGQVYAQPLYMSGVTLPDGTVHNIIFIATEHDSVYAFDANDPTAGNNGDGILWHVSYIDPANGIDTFKQSDAFNCSQIIPEIGITGTPVIDPATNIMYLVAQFKDTSSGTPVYHQQIHALDVTTGNDVAPPVEIQAGALGGADGGNYVLFDPQSTKERAGLVLSHGVVYTSWTSHCDHTPFHGWVIGYTALSNSVQSMQQVAVFCTAPNGQLASIWGGDGAPGIDADGNMYFVTGNGAFAGNDYNPDKGTYPETVLKLDTGAGQPLVSDYFTPFNWSDLDKTDKDFGSGQVMLLPNQPGPIPHLLVVAGKEGKIYLLNRDNLGKYNGFYDNVWQEIPGAIKASGAYDVPTYFNTGAANGQFIYYAGQGDNLRAFQLFDNGMLSTSSTSQSGHVFSAVHGATPSLSANGKTNGIVWAIDPDSAAATLYAFDALDVSNELYNSKQNSVLDGGVKFSIPTIADGEVFVGTNDQVAVYGLLPMGLPAGRAAALALAIEHLSSPLAPGLPMDGQAVAQGGTATAPTVALPDQGATVAGALINGQPSGSSQVLHDAGSSLANDVDALFGTNSWTAPLA